MKQVVVSGIRATGRLHLGNYFGALRRFAEMSEDPNLRCFFFVADLHTMTTPETAQDISTFLPEIVRDYIAAGVNPENVAIYDQSRVPEVTELMWYLMCLTGLNEVSSLPTFKDKASKEMEYGGPTAGLMMYPILMAADILGPRADLVPVGKDQAPHLELTQTLANRFNFRFGDFFPIPDAMRDDMVTVPGLSVMSSEGTFPKMGKSDDNTINLSDTDEEVLVKLRRAPTDVRRVQRTDPGDPANCAIGQLHTFVSSDEMMKVVHTGCTTASMGCVECKSYLADGIRSELAEFRERRASIADNNQFVTDILEYGASQVRPRFAETLERVRRALGV